MHLSRDTLYISDLDGTLLRNDATLSPYSRTGLQRLLQEGIAFTVASARSVVSMRPILAGVDLALPIIEFNGAFLSDLVTGQHLLVNSIEPAIADTLYQLIRYAGHTPFISTFTGTHDRVYYAEMRNDGMIWHLNNRQRQQDHRLHYALDLSVALRDQVIRFYVIDRPEPLAELRQTIREHFDSSVICYYYENDYSPGWYWLEVQTVKATKALAIQGLIAYTGMNEHELVVFGDHINDVSMFQIAQRGVAVANAQPEVKELATVITDSNEADGVVRYLEQEWAERKVQPSDDRPTT